MKTKLNTVFIFCFLWIFASCDSNRVFEQNVEIPDEVWNYKNTVNFSVNISDTIFPHNFYFNLRHRNTYPYSNFYFFFYTTLPSGKTIKDTVQCPLADPSGKWYGTGISTVISNQILFKTNHVFKQAGTYKFTIEQAMRDTEIAPILDAGLRIEKM